MNREYEQAAFVAGVFVGGLVMALAMALGVNHERGTTRQQAIEHGAARYNATSGEFEWIENAEMPNALTNED